MKKIIILVLVLTSLNVLGQSKKETEDWIIQKYNEFERPQNSGFDLKIENDCLLYLWYFGDKETGKYGGTSKIKLKDIKMIEIVHERFNTEDKEGWTKIQVLFDKGNYEYKKLGDSYFTKGEGSGFKIILDSEFMKNGLPERMERGFTYLVKLNGGNLKIKKEPF